MLLVIDGNNVAWAGFHALCRPMNADTPEKLRRAALLGLAQGVLGLTTRGGEAPGTTPGEAAEVVVAFDHGRPLRRRQIFPAYQTGRERNPSFMEYEEYVVGAIDRFVEMARLLPVTVLRGTNTEADDLAAAATGQHAGPVRIASTDRDFLQLVDERVTVYSPVKKLLVTVANFADATAPSDSGGTAAPFPRERYLDYRAASGDASDDLPGIPGVGTLTAARLLAQRPIEAYFAAPRLAAQVLGRRQAKLEAALASGEAREVFERNRDLMDLRAAAERFPSLDEYRAVGRWDERGARAWLEDERIARTELESTVRVLARLAGEGPSPAAQGRMDL
ncbi:MAG: hypothetical protein HY875_09525 [Chloroflexi bacterium]|nr:hypothetical protein [Chloroflexota bacterium]